MTALDTGNLQAKMYEAKTDRGKCATSVEDKRDRRSVVTFLHPTRTTQVMDRKCGKDWSRAADKRSQRLHDANA